MNPNLRFHIRLLCIKTIKNFIIKDKELKRQENLQNLNLDLEQLVLELIRLNKQLDQNKFNIVNIFVLIRKIKISFIYFYFNKQVQQQQYIQNDEYILIVDDEPFNHETLCMMLKNMGFKNFLKAFNGQQCVDVVLQNHNKIYMIMMDIDMPIMNGIDTTKQLERLISNNKICYIPIIGCTAHEDYESHLQCFDAGMILFSFCLFFK